nr:DUF3662 and FHA domain-containing protein [Adlercreutzia sp. ZJ138]
MGFLSRFEGRMEDTFEGAADKVIKTPISPVQITKKAEKQMRREKMVGAGKQFAPTLYTVLVNPDDDQRLFGYYPTLAGETETYLAAKASEQGMVMDGQPLVRFVVDDALKHGKFEVIAEMVAAPIVAQLRAEEMQRYGLAPAGRPGAPGVAAQRFNARGAGGDYGMGAQPGFDQPVQQVRSARQPQAAQMQPQFQPQAYADDYDDVVQDQGAYGRAGAREPLPYVPEEELDYSIDYGEYTFNSLDYDDYQGNDDGDAESAPFPQGVPNVVASRGAGAAPRKAAAPRVAAAAGAGAAAAAAAGAAAAVNRPASNVPADWQPKPNTVMLDQGVMAPANPEPPARAACLVDMASSRRYDLRGSHMTIGRESANDIQINDINASRRHAELSLDPSGVWVITDLGSTNGTMVNNRAIAKSPLALGDRITIGTTILMYTTA